MKHSWIGSVGVGGDFCCIFTVPSSSLFADKSNMGSVLPETSALLSYVIASLLVAIVPGPSVTLITANALKHGARAGMLSVFGTQIGVGSVVAVLVLGYAAIVNTMGFAFEVLRYAGAAYLIWLGIRMWRSDGNFATAEAGKRPFGSFMLQGFLVLWANPKALLFLGAFIPQFVVPDGNAGLQVAFLGVVFMVVTTVCDSMYALAAGGAGAWLSKRRVKLLEGISGTFLIGGGLWLLATRR